MTLTQIAGNIINFINGVLVPLVFAVAFAMFLFGVFKFYFLKPGDATARKEGRGFIIGGIVAFAVMLSVWGLVNIVTGTLPFGNNYQPNLPTFTNTSGTTGTQPAPFQSSGVQPAPTQTTGVQSAPTPNNGSTGSDPTNGLY